MGLAESPWPVGSFADAFVNLAGQVVRAVRVVQIVLAGQAGQALEEQPEFDPAALAWYYLQGLALAPMDCLDHDAIRKQRAGVSLPGKLDS